MILRILLLIALCGSGLFFLTASSSYQHARDEVAACRSIYELSDDPYWREYRQWSAMSLEQQFQSPWGRKPYGEVPADKRAEYQRIHLMAELESIAAGTHHPNLYARELYGADWSVRAHEWIDDIRGKNQAMTRWLLATLVSGALLTIFMLTTLVRLLRQAAMGRKHGKSVHDERHSAPDQTVLRDGALSEAAQSSESPAAPVSKGQEPESSQRTETIARRRQLQYNASEFWSHTPPAGGTRASKTNWNHTVSEAPGEPVAEGGPVKLTVAKPLTDGVITPFVRTEPEPAVAEDKPDKAGGHSEPEPADLSKLTSELSALREYASRQQSRVEKLQDGYDWNILKNFCLRIIRCIDNLETQIEKTEKAGDDVAALQNTYDELVFALESSSIEQYRPDLNSAYKGQEKLMEVVKQRKLCIDPEMDGAIAAVIRPGYHYIVDANQTKIVRTALVMLYQAKVAVAAG